MTNFNAIDLSTLPPPAVVEALNYEALFAARKIEFNALSPLLLDDHLQPLVMPAQLITDPDGSLWYKIPVDNMAGLYYLSLDSDPVTRLLQADVYRELLVRQTVNDAAHATMIAYAIGADLDNIAARYGVRRLLITAATDTTPAVYEEDVAFRKRTLLSLEGLSTAGPKGAYIFHALSADGRVKDARAVSTAPAQVTVTILSYEGNGAASADLLSVVHTALNADDVRPISDEVIVQTAEIVEYDLIANITFFPGPSHQPVLDLIRAKWTDYAVISHRIGFSLEDSAVKAVLHQQGAWRIEVVSPVLPLAVGQFQAAFCRSVTLIDKGNSDAV
jgi:phage-related baseplate assembly protein